MLIQLASPSFTAFFASIFFSCLTIASGSAAKAPSPADDSSRDGAALQKLVKSFEAAWNKADVESIALLFSPDGQLVSPNESSAKTRPKIKELIAKERESRLREATIRQGVESIYFSKGNRGDQR
jgi:nuclear transport factor 2 (NTF2) superfamily protein